MSARDGRQPGGRVDSLAAEMAILVARLGAMGLGAHVAALVGLARPCAYGVVVPAGLLDDGRSAMAGPDAPSGGDAGEGMAALLTVDLSEVPEAARIGFPEAGTLRLSVGGGTGSCVRHEASHDAGCPVPLADAGDGEPMSRLAFTLRLDPMPDALDAMLRAGTVTEAQRDAYDALCGASAFPPGAALKLGGHCLASGVPASFAAAARAGAGKGSMRESMRWGNLATVVPPWADAAGPCLGDALSVACHREAMARGDLAGTHAQVDDFPGIGVDIGAPSP